MAVHGDVWTWQVAKVAGDRSTAAWPTVGEELGAPQHVETDHYATEREGEEVRAHQLVNVDDGMPGLADAAGHGHTARLRGGRRRSTSASRSSGSICRWLFRCRFMIGSIWSRKQKQATILAFFFFLVVVTSSIRRTG